MERLTLLDGRWWEGCWSQLKTLGIPWENMTTLAVGIRSTMIDSTNRSAQFNQQEKIVRSIAGTFSVVLGTKIPCAGNGPSIPEVQCKVHHSIHTILHCSISKNCGCQAMLGGKLPNDQTLYSVLWGSYARSRSGMNPTSEKRASGGFLRWGSPFHHPSRAYLGIETTMVTTWGLCGKSPSSLIRSKLFRSSGVPSLRGTWVGDAPA